MVGSNSETYMVVVNYIDNEKERHQRIESNLSRKDACEILQKHKEGKTFMVRGKYIHPSYVIEELHVYDENTARVNRDVTRILLKSLPSKTAQKTTEPLNSGKRKKVFIVHGRDETQALLLQKYLKDQLKVGAVMFDDLPDKGRTIIEQLEYIQDNVGYAFIIGTPDDIGCLTRDIEELGKMLAGLKSIKGETVAKIFGMLRTRARQNVVFEHGLFIGALGRGKVCCLLRKDVEEKPSDINGILYKSFYKSVSEVFHEIPEELKAAGYETKV